jgi:hypothetical protein
MLTEAETAMVFPFRRHSSRDLGKMERHALGVATG